jgi:hypothetical protein
MKLVNKIISLEFSPQREQGLSDARSCDAAGLAFGLRHLDCACYIVILAAGTGDAKLNFEPRSGHAVGRR